MANNKAETPAGFGGAMGDPFELMKKMWSMTGIPEFPGAGAMSAGMPQGMPSMIAPTFDVNELDKRIKDLRAVEQWLALNAGMLRTTIQSLEVQRATIATLRGITDNMMAPMSQASAASPSSASSSTFGQTSQSAEKTADWPPMPRASSSPAPAAKASKSKPTAKQASAADSTLNPAAWWNSLQDQFTQIAAAAASAPSAKKHNAASKTPARKAAKKAR